MADRIYLDDATVEQLRAELARREGPTLFAVTSTEAERGVLVDTRDGRRERRWPVDPPDALELGPGERVVEPAPLSPVAREALASLVKAVQDLPEWHAAMLDLGLKRTSRGWWRGEALIIEGASEQSWWLRETGRGPYTSEEEAVRTWQMLTAWPPTPPSGTGRATRQPARRHAAAREVSRG